MRVTLNQHSLAKNVNTCHQTTFTSLLELHGLISIDPKLAHLFPSCLQGVTDTRRHLLDAVSRVPLLGSSLPLCGSPPTHSRGPHTARTSVPGQLPHLCCQSCSQCHQHLLFLLLLLTTVVV